MWKYVNLVNADLAILLTMVAGAAAILARIFHPPDAMLFSTFLFKFALAASVIQGLG